MKGSRGIRLEESKEEGKWSERERPQRAALQCVHVIEGMIQLLAGSLEFQLLIVQFVCTSLSRGSRWRKTEKGKGNTEGERGKLKEYKRLE